MNNEIVHLIIKLCFSINDLKNDKQPNNTENLLFYSSYVGIKSKMDEIFEATDNRSFASKINEAKVYAKKTLKIHKTLPKEFKGRNETVATIETIINHLEILADILRHPS